LFNPLRGVVLATVCGSITPNIGGSITAVSDTSLLAWISLLLQVEPGLLLVAFVLLACLVVDYKTYPLYGLDHWLPMRLHLSIVAVVFTGLPALLDLSGLALEHL
jgi:hypothetical protein